MEVWIRAGVPSWVSEKSRWRNDPAEHAVPAAGTVAWESVFLGLISDRKQVS